MAIFTSNKKRENTTETPQIGTVIGSDIEFKGSLKGNKKDIIRIQGTFDGEIDTAGDLHITETGVVLGTVHAENVMVSGTFKGTLRANGCLEIHKGGIVMADAKMARVVIDEGGTFSGKSEMVIPESTVTLLQEKV